MRYILSLSLSLTHSFFFIRRISFELAGFSLNGKGDMGYEKSDISKSLKSSQKWSIRPNAGGDDVNSLISSLVSISTGGMVEDDTVYDTMVQSAQNILSGEGADPEPIKAVLMPLSSVKAVHTLFVDNPEHADTRPFVGHMNEIYMEVVALTKQVLY